ncbi:YeeE/YedE family protein [Ensifer adhaerens]|uniref:YeeE/YedE family protein n=1 Tax=Ensifer adhaerens TaxID=106592 RepID=UPI00211A7C1C|nr:YeeE/YedE thiosulfate transporter family protein [Ensifer adhaerens]
MSEINFLWPLSGGLLIGLSAGLYLLTTGRIAGISGLVAAAAGLTGTGSSKLALGFLAGILGGAFAAATFFRQPDIEVTPSLPLLLIGGLLVGFGTRLGSGCTSGHGVCGLARLSQRSIVATLTFMTVAALTVLAMRLFAGAL